MNHLFFDVRVTTACFSILFNLCTSTLDIVLLVSRLRCRAFRTESFRRQWRCEVDKCLII